jgi:hypothetical protein
LLFSIYIEKYKKGSEVCGSWRLTWGSVLENNIRNIWDRDFGNVKIISGCVVRIFPILFSHGWSRNHQGTRAREAMKK